MRNWQLIDGWMFLLCICLFTISAFFHSVILSFLLLLKLLWQVPTVCVIDSLQRPHTISQDANDKVLSVGAQLTPFTIYSCRAKVMHFDNPTNLISPLSLRQESLHKHLQVLWAFKKERKHVFSHSVRPLNHFQTSSSQTNVSTVVFFSPYMMMFVVYRLQRCPHLKLDNTAAALKRLQ